MAATIVHTSSSFMLTVIDADWLWSTPFPGHTTGIKIVSILFKPGNANDIMFIRDGSITGPIVFHRQASLADNVPSYYRGSLLRPVIDFSECTLNAGHNVTVVLEKG